MQQMVHRGLIVGRFQPPHLGHLELIKYALTKVDEIVVAIAAAQISHTEKNPFTAGERVEMMRIMLQNSGIDDRKYWILPTQDIADNALWVTHLERLLPEFDVFFGNNPFTNMLFSEAGYEIETTPMFERDKYEASRIRSLIANGKSVTKFLDPQVRKLLKHYDIKSRMKGIITTDRNYASSGHKPGSELQDL